MRRGRTPCGTSDDGGSGIFSSPSCESCQSARSRKRVREGRPTYLAFNFVDSGEVDIVLLDDTWVQRVEVHDKDILVPKPSLRLEDQASLVLVPLRFRHDSCGAVLILGFGLHCSGGLLAPCLIRADVLEAMELVQKNVLVSFGSTSV